MDVKDMTFFISHRNATGFRSTRTNNPAKAFSFAMNAPKPVNITCWCVVDSATHYAIPQNFVCDSKDDVFKAFGCITGGRVKDTGGDLSDTD